jgi:hypothetical protein
MAEWVVAYCKKSVAAVTAREMLEELRRADLVTLAEGLGIDEDDVEEAEKHLRFEKEKRDPGFVSASLCWKPEGRPIQIRREIDPREAIDETLENLPAGGGAGLARVRAHLAASVEAVSFELGGRDSNGVGAVLAEVIAFLVAKRGEGIVEFYGREWASPDDRGGCIWKKG